MRKLAHPVSLLFRHQCKHDKQNCIDGDLGHKQISDAIKRMTLIHVPAARQHDVAAVRALECRGRHYGPVSIMPNILLSLLPNTGTRMISGVELSYCVYTSSPFIRLFGRRKVALYHPPVPDTTVDVDAGMFAVLLSTYRILSDLRRFPTKLDNINSRLCLPGISVADVWTMIENFQPEHEAQRIALIVVILARIRTDDPPSLTRSNLYCTIIDCERKLMMLRAFMCIQSDSVMEFLRLSRVLKSDDDDTVSPEQHLFNAEAASFYHSHQLVHCAGFDRVISFDPVSLASSLWQPTKRALIGPIANGCPFSRAPLWASWALIGFTHAQNLNSWSASIARLQTNKLKQSKITTALVIDMCDKLDLTRNTQPRLDVNEWIQTQQSRHDVQLTAPQLNPMESNIIPPCIKSMMQKLKERSLTFNGKLVLATFMGTAFANPLRSFVGLLRNYDPNKVKTHTRTAQSALKKNHSPVSCQTMQNATAYSDDRQPPCPFMDIEECAKTCGACVPPNGLSPSPLYMAASARFNEMQGFQEALDQLDAL